jgi:hypothetical protein
MELLRPKIAAKALELLAKPCTDAGEISEAIFALGIISTCLPGVLVLPGLCGYAIKCMWPARGIEQEVWTGKTILSDHCSVHTRCHRINFTNTDPIKALIYLL